MVARVVSTARHTVRTAKSYPGKAGRRQTIERLGAEGETAGNGAKWAMLSIPVTAFGLGCWQVYRRDWKEGLVVAMEKRLSEEPIPLPTVRTPTSSFARAASPAEMRDGHHRRMAIVCGAGGGGGEGWGSRVDR